MSYRQLSALGLLACAGGFAFALFSQYGLGYEPCPLCIFQRLALLATGLMFGLGAAFGPGAWGRWVWSGLAALAAAIGAAIAGRHVWLQHLPEDQVPACGPTLGYLLDMLPVTEVVSIILKGDGNCAKIDAAWLGIGLPAWTLMAFAGLALWALASPRLARRGSHALRNHSPPC